MATAIAEAFVTLRPDLTRFANEAAAGIAAAGDKAAQGFAEKFSKAGDKLSSVGKKLSTFVSLPIAAGLGGAIKAASDLNESMSKTDQVFGDSADAIHTFASTAAKDMGLSKRAAEEASGSFGNLFTSMGLARPKAAEMSTSLVKLAADLASFNNLDPEDALEKLRSGLVGEIEPLRSLGVQFNEAQVQAKGMALGLADAHGQLSEAAKVQVRYALILEQTKNAQGDFARTSDGVANQMRIAKAQFEDAASALGTNLLPVATKAIGVASRLAQGFADMPVPLQTAALGGAALAAAIGPIATLAGNAAKAVGTLTKAVQFLATSNNIAALSASGLGFALVGIGAGVAAYTVTTNAFSRANQALADNQALATNNVALGKATVESAVDAYINATEFTHDAAEATKNYAETFGPLQEKARNALSALSENTKVAKERIVQLANSLGINLGKMSEAAKDKLTAAIGAITGAVSPSERLAEATEVLGNQFATAKEKVDAYAEAVDATLGVFLDAQTSAIRYASQVDALSTAIAENGRVVGLNGEKQRAVASALNDVVRAANADVEAMAKAGIITNDAATKSSTLIEKLADLRKRFPELAGAIDDYIAHLNQIPRDITTRLEIRADGFVIDRNAKGEITFKGFADGGVVPGPIGSPQLVLAHGGETFIPTHKPGFQASDLDRFLAPMSHPQSAAPLIGGDVILYGSAKESDVGMLTRELRVQRWEMAGVW